MPQLTPAESTETAPRLSFDAEPSDARAVVLVLHGGRSRSTAPVRANQLAVLRMRPIGAALSRAGARRGLVVARLQFAVRGWNDERRSPVPDANRALDELTRRWPGLPVGLVGHSMGGRTALYAGGHDGVRSIVGLAPWLEPGDAVTQLAARQVLFVHGDSDRMTSPQQSFEYEQQLSRVAAATGGSVGYVSLRGAKHAMLQRPGLWHELATGFTLSSLLSLPPEETVGADAANILRRASESVTPVVG